MEDIPTETAKMLNNIAPKLDKFSKVLNNCKKQVVLDDVINAVKSLEEMNSTIYECSLTINDCYSILTDYIAAKLPNQEAPEDAAEEG